jgi:hypothetical protein
MEAFHAPKLGMTQRPLEQWTRENPDKLLPLLRKFYKGEGIPFPY